MIEALTEGDGTVEVGRLEAGFSLQELLTRIGGDEDLVASFLYYVGLLTLEPADLRTRLRVPNLVVRKLLLDRLLEIHYREALVRRFGEGSVNPRSWAVVGIGLERLLGEEVRD